MAMELACGRGCAVSAWGAASSSLMMKGPLSSRPQRVTLRRVARPVRAGEEVGTEEPSVTSETEEKSSSSSSSSNGSTPFPTGRKWTGYVEKDTAGQTNIYAVEPTVYVSESVFSSGEAGSSAEGSSNSVAAAVGISVAVIASAAAVLFTVGKNAPVAPTEAVGYNGPPLSYYVTKFSPPVEEAITVEESVAAPSISEGEEESS